MSASKKATSASLPAPRHRPSVRGWPQWGRASTVPESNRQPSGLGRWLLALPLNADHPLYQLNMRRRKWWANGTAPARYGLEVVLWTVTVLLLVWLVFVLACYAWVVNSFINSGNVVQTWHIPQLVAITTLWVGGISVGLSYLLDFIVMAITVNSISGERNAHRWHLIQLTPLSGQSVIEALYQANQLRLWRITLMVVGTRVAVIAAFGLLVFVLLPVIENYNPFSWITELPDNPLLYSYVGLVVLLIGVVYVVEPIWRLRAMTALAMGLSAQVRRFITALPLAFVLMLSVWLLMLAAVAGLTAAMVWATDQMYRLPHLDYDAEEMLITLTIVGFVLVQVVLIQGSFRLIRGLGLRWALRRSSSLRERWAVTHRPTSHDWWQRLMWWAPHSGVNGPNPLLTALTKRVRWYQPMHIPWRRTLVLTLLPLALVLAVCGGAVAALTWLNQTGSASLASRGTLAQSYDDAILSIIFVVASMLVFADVLVSQMTMQVIRRSQHGAVGDLLRLTPLSAESIVAGYRAAARVRTWQLTVLMMVFAALAVFLFITIYFTDWLFLGSNFTLSLYDLVRTEALLLAVLAASIPIVIPVKVRLVVALTLLPALRLRGVAMEAVRAALLVVVTGVQFGVLYASGYGHYLGLLQVSGYGRYSAINWAGVLGGVLLFVFLMTVVEQAALNWTKHRLRRANV